MASFQETQNLRSNAPTTNLAPMESNSDQILCGTDDLLFYQTFRNSRRPVQKQAVILELSWSCMTKPSVQHGTQYNPCIGRTAISLGTSESPTSSQIIRNIVREEAKRIYSIELDKLLIKVVKDAFLCFRSWLRKHYGLNNASSYIVEIVLTEMAHSGSLNKMFDSIVERWTKSSTFMIAFTGPALTSSRFVRAAAKFILANIEKQSTKATALELNQGTLSSITTLFSIRLRIIRGRNKTQTCDG